MQVVYPVGSSMVYLSAGTWFSLVFGSKLFTNCSQPDLTDERPRQSPQVAPTQFGFSASRSNTPPSLFVLSVGRQTVQPPELLEEA